MTMLDKPIAKLFLVIFFVLLAGFLGFRDGIINIFQLFMTILVGALAGILFDVLDGKLDELKHSVMNGIAIVMTARVVQLIITLFLNILKTGG